MLEEIKLKTQGLTASCGIACNQLLAKICSDINKPGGRTYLALNVNEVAKFIEELPVKRLPGVGKVQEMIMNGLGIVKCKDMIDKATEISINFNYKTFEFLIK
jgi:DNA polymerase kappa